MSDPDSLLVNIGVGLYCVLWTITYIVFIHKGFKDKTYCIPAPAIAVNISWEFIFSFVYPDQNMYRTWLYRFWFIPDIIIVGQLFYYGRNVQTIYELRKYFFTITLASIAASFLGVWSFVHFYGDWTGTEVAYIMNSIMSILFVFFYFSRRDLRGISIIGAWTKMLGTGIASIIVHYAYHFRPEKTLFSFLEFLFIIIFVFDCLYLVLVMNRKKELMRSSANKSAEWVSTNSLSENQS